jgi:hypothetical protein
MTSGKDIFISKISIPGKNDDELSYSFFEENVEHQNGSFSLFGMFHITASREIYHTILKETVKRYLDFYHRNPKGHLNALKQNLTDPDEFIFENAIQYVNQCITDLLLQHQDQLSHEHGFDSKRAHIILGALCGDSIYLNVTGTQLSALYVYPVFKKQNFSHYSVAPMLGEDSGDSHRLFSQVISGKVSIPGGTVVICNQPFLEFVSTDQMKQAIMSKAIELLPSHFQNILAKVRSRHDLSALLIRPNYKPSTEVSAHRQTVSNESMADLISTEKGTDTIMAPALGSSLRSLLKKFIFSLLFPAAKKVFVSLQKIDYANIWRVFFSVGTTFGKRCHTAVKQSLHVTKGIVQNIRTKGIASLKPTINVRDCASYFRSVQSALQGAFKTCGDFVTQFKKQGFRSFAGLSIRSKSILILFVLFVFLFVQSVIALNRKKESEQQTLAFNQAVALIQERFHATESSLIYEDVSRAQSLFLDARQLITQLPVKTPGASERISELQQSLERLSFRIFKMVVVNEPVAVADLSTQIPSLSSLQLHTSGSQIALSTTDALYQFAIDDGQARQIDTQAKIPDIGCSILTAKSFIVCNTERDRLFEVSLDGATIRPIAIEIASDERIERLALYNGRLYVFSPSGKIYRHDKKGDGFGAGSIWLREAGLVLTDTRSFAVDGSVYVVRANNSIAEYSAGKQKNSSVPSLYPQQGSFAKIWTDAETPHLYVLDPSQKRLIILDKKSLSLVQQITSEKFSDLKDFAVMPAKKMIFFLNGTTVFGVPYESVK